MKSKNSNLKDIWNKFKTLALCAITVMVFITDSIVALVQIPKGWCNWLMYPWKLVSKK